MILHDDIGPIDVKPGDYFLCKLPPHAEPALMEIVCPIKSPSGLIAAISCRIVRGLIRDDRGADHGVGAVSDFPPRRVAAAIRRYRAKQAARRENPSAVGKLGQEPKN